MKHRRMDAISGETTYPSETDEQVGFVNWFRACFPGVIIFAIPNGGHRSIITAKRLKDEGVLPGVPDLYIPAWKIWVEMKRATGGRLSKEQRVMIDYLTLIGHNIIIGKGAHDASRQIMEFVENHKMKKGAA